MADNITSISSFNKYVNKTQVYNTENMKLNVTKNSPVNINITFD